MKILFQDFDPYSHTIDTNKIIEVKSQLLTRDVVSKIVADHTECPIEEVPEYFSTMLDTEGGMWSVTYSEERTYFCTVLDHLIS